MARLFCNGDAMRGGVLHHNVAAHTFLGTVRTTPDYRFYSVRDEFPALVLAPNVGAAIEGELYDVPMNDIRARFLPDEPPELELTVVQLENGDSVLAVGLRPGILLDDHTGLTDITAAGSWRRYRGLTAPSSGDVS
ncbi:gamma-glutamylcyclotransferase [Rhodococcus sp. MEB041]|uniref:allophanate hydrolase-related protein n=1 Tax=Rhodococcus sp. MEB041 TaxID=3040323 RepID=UPI00254CCD06|nr:gamma-glutamylcyclotransferase [Rhodococcus sp. MEB041]